jgi:molecular chaperone DnaJ
METKDYYGILGITPSASLQEIKKAYRLLAMRYHPDKHNDSSYSAIVFTEIKEAYDVLTDPRKKQYYLQQRWYDRSINKKPSTSSLDPAGLLKQALELEKYVATLDVFRLNKEGLLEYIQDMLTPAAIERLRILNDTELNRQLVLTVMRTMSPLSFSESEPVRTILQSIAARDESSLEMLDRFTRKKQKQNRFERYSLLLVILLTVATCFLIWLAAR